MIGKKPAGEENGARNAALEKHTPMMQQRIPSIK